eukprot:755587-Hanusia_phi.AAC.3
MEQVVARGHLQQLHVEVGARAMLLPCGVSGGVAGRDGQRCHVACSGSFRRCCLTVRGRSG